MVDWVIFEKELLLFRSYSFWSGCSRKKGFERIELGILFVYLVNYFLGVSENFLFENKFLVFRFFKLYVSRMCFFFIWGKLINFWVVSLFIKGEEGMELEDF